MSCSDQATAVSIHGDVLHTPLYEHVRGRSARDPIGLPYAMAPYDMPERLDDKSQNGYADHWEKGISFRIGLARTIEPQETNAAAGATAWSGPSGVALFREIEGNIKGSGVFAHDPRGHRH